MSNIYYVYLHRKPSGEIFYIGKGKKARAYDKSGRSAHWQSLVSKYGYEIEILYKDLSEIESFQIEVDVIGMLKLTRQGGTLINQTLGGVGAKGIFCNEHTKKLRSKRMRGNNHPNSDKTVYTFIHFYTEEEFTGTRQDFILTKGIQIRDLFNATDPRTNVLGWCLKENINKLSRTKTDNRIHTFKHTTGKIIQATRKDFRDITGVETVKLFANPPHKRKSIHGWSLTTLSS